ncbi:MAG: RNA polymerase sigma factor [Acidobacteriia bacterium]|nr:RNA polymerase sigma factor [Terriglobia bacterium]
MISWSRKQGSESLRSLRDESLCREVTAGSHEAFLELFDRYWHQVFRLAYVVIRDESEAEDLAQDLFLDVHRSMLRFDSQRGSFRTLLFRYAYTRAIDHRRRLETRRFYSQVPLEDVLGSSLAGSTPLGYGLSIEEGTRLIEQAMKHLDEKQRMTVKAYFFQGLSLEEIATNMGDSFGNVRHYLYRGLHKMRRFLTARSAAWLPGESNRALNERLQDKMTAGFTSEVPDV